MIGMGKGFIFSSSAFPFFHLTSLFSFHIKHTPVHKRTNAQTCHDKDQSTLKESPSQTPAKYVKREENQPTGTGCEEGDLKMKPEDMAQVGY